ncbi:MAG TPA: hypothetical protein VGJ53_02540 [Micromonosporaceae bacterium]|jgi:hypothetical protein
MNAIDRFTESCIAQAGRRWPEDISADMIREWHAELAALRADPTVGSCARSARMLAFAASLACSPAVEAEDAPASSWRDRATGLGRALTALAGAAGVTLLAAALFNAVHDAYRLVDPHLATGPAIAVNVLLVAAAATAMWWLGGVAARRGAFAPAPRSAPRVALSTVPLGLTMYLFLLIGNEIAVMPFMGWIDITPGIAAWTVLTAVAAGLAMRLIGAGRRRLGQLVATAGAAIALECAAVGGSLHAAASLEIGLGSAPAWFPLALLPGGTAGFGRVLADAGPSLDGRAAVRASDILLGNVSAMVGPLLLCSTFLVAYAMRAARGTVGTSAAAAADEAPARRRTPERTLAAALGVVGLALWVYHAALVHDPDSSSAGRALRTSAIVLIGSALVVVLAGRGPVVVPAVGAVTVLYAGDRVADFAQRPGLATAVALGMVGCATICGAVLASHQLVGRGTTDRAARATLVAIAVVAAWAAPRSEELDSTGSVAVSAPLLAALTWLMAVTAAQASRRSRLGRTATVAVAGVPLLVVAGPAAHAWSSPRAPLLVQVLLVVVALAAARWDGTARRVPQATRWLLLAAGAAVLSLPVSDALRQPDGLVGTTLARIAHNSNVFGFGFATNAVGRIGLAVVLGVLAARWIGSDVSARS